MVSVIVKLSTLLSFDGYVHFVVQIMVFLFYWQHFRRQAQLFKRAGTGRRNRKIQREYVRPQVRRRRLPAGVRLLAERQRR